MRGQGSTLKGAATQGLSAPQPRRWLQGLGLRLLGITQVPNVTGTGAGEACPSGGHHPWCQYNTPCATGDAVNVSCCAASSGGGGRCRAGTSVVVTKKPAPMQPHASCKAGELSQGRSSRRATTPAGAARAAPLIAPLFALRVTEPTMALRLAHYHLEGQTRCLTLCGGRRKLIPAVSLGR